MKKISFVKMSGAGNDFILLNRAENRGLVLSDDEINHLCDRRNGIGGDGIIIISNSPKVDFTMQYFNADGSTGTLCGNGARCAIKFAVNSGFTDGKIVKFLSDDIKYSGEYFDDENIRFDLHPPKIIEPDKKIEVENWKSKAAFVHTGSPHIVINIGENEKNIYSLDKLPVEKIGREIRYLEEFEPGGTNVNFIAMKNDEIEIRTYERGVEAETLACGTGSVASAITAFLKYDFKPPVKLLTKGGDYLSVNFTYNAGKFADVSLSGPAKEIFRGEIIIDKFS